MGPVTIISQLTGMGNVQMDASRGSDVYLPVPPFSTPAPPTLLLSQLTQEPARCCSRRLQFAQNQFHRVPTRIQQLWGLGVRFSGMGADG